MSKAIPIEVRSGNGWSLSRSPNCWMMRSLDVDGRCSHNIALLPDASVGDVKTTLAYLETTQINGLARGHLVEALHALELELA